MKKVASSESLITINHYKNILQGADIACEIRNEHLGGIVGEMPFVEVWPELWVRHDLDADHAKQLIEAANTDVSDAPAWKCRHCGEDNEGQFGACWSCGTSLT